MNTDLLSGISYISELEKEIFMLVHRGVSFENVACRYNLSVEKIRSIYFEVKEKIDVINLEEIIDMSSYTFKCSDIPEFLKRMKISDAPYGYEEVKLALEYAQDNPESLENMINVFYPFIAQKVDKTANEVGNLIRKAFSYSFNQKYSESKIFFDKYEIRRVAGIAMSKTLKCALECIEDK